MRGVCRKAWGFKSPPSTNENSRFDCKREQNGTRNVGCRSGLRHGAERGFRAGHLHTQAETYGTDTDGSTLQWVRYTPSGTGPWPAVVAVHGGGFRFGSPNDLNLVPVCKDLARTGYLCFAITYRLAQNTICNQPATHHLRRTGVAGPTTDIHDQMDDVRTAIIAARQDPQCLNKPVYLIGGSAGGTHALFAAVTGTAGVDKPDAVVALSGSYDGSDLRGLPPPSPPNIRPFVQDWEMYTDVGHSPVVVPPPPPDLSDTPTPIQLAAMHAASPVAQPIVAADVPPVLLICSKNDPMPPQQLVDMVSALETAGVQFTTWPILSRHQKNIVPGKRPFF